MTPNDKAKVIQLYQGGLEDEEIADELKLPVDEVADAIDEYDRQLRSSAPKPELISNLRTFILLCIANYDHQHIYELFEDGCTQQLRNQIYSLADPDTPEPFRSAMINIGFPDF